MFRDVKRLSVAEPESLEPGRVEDVAEFLVFAEHYGDARPKSSSEGVIKEQGFSCVSDQSKATG